MVETALLQTVYVLFFIEARTRRVRLGDPQECRWHVASSTHTERRAQGGSAMEPPHDCTSW